MQTPETYEQALAFLFNRIDYERLHAGDYSASDFRLGRMERLLERCGNPHRRIPAVHVAGTKGKGSTAVMVASILTAAGHRPGLYTSPHLTSIEERISVAGRHPTPDEFLDLVQAIHPHVVELDRAPHRQAPSYFDITTALAWLEFVRQGADAAVLEVGLGGRLDSTNVCCPAVCLITTISRDHVHLLGTELAQIAAEKAGIIKPGVPVICGTMHETARREIERISQERNAPCWHFGRDVRWSESSAKPCEPASADPAFWIDVATPCGMHRSLPVPLLGRHQADNVALAVAAVDRLREAGWRLPPESIAEGLRRVRWPARIEVVRRDPTVIVDAAHNWASVHALCDTLRREFPGRRLLIFSASRDKDVAGMLRLLLPAFHSVILTEFQSNPRAVPAEELLAIARGLTPRHLHMAADPPSAWERALRLDCAAASGAGRPFDLVVVAGSLFLAGELRERILRSAPAGTAGR
jgi:dihydrofolate synthase/folylpolyglutamate synthase